MQADAIQETVINCYEHIGRLKNADYFKTWLTRILINNCKDILAAGKRVYPLEQIEEQENTCMELQNYEFQELMNSLDEKYRIVLLLYYGEGFKIKEIAQILEMDENTVKTRLSRGQNTCMELQNYEFQELMNSLDEKYRIVLLLYYGEGFKIKEIAQILEMDENTVKTRLSRGRKKFEHAYSMC